MPPEIDIPRQLQADRRRPLVARMAHSLMLTLRFWTQTEVHVYSFSVAANVLLSFFPFLIVSLSLTRKFFDQRTAVAAIDSALREFFPDALGEFLRHNLPQPRPVELVSMVLLFFTANGIFEPLEVALNHVWGIPKNRSFVRNQLVSLLLIFTCGGLALFSLSVSAWQQGASRGYGAAAILSVVLFKILAIPFTVLVLFLIYRYLPNGRPPLERVIPAAIAVGMLLEALKYVNLLVWPWLYPRLSREYGGVFHNSVTLLFLGFVATMLVLAGAEWAARGHRLDRNEVRGPA